MVLRHTLEYNVMYLYSAVWRTTGFLMDNWGEQYTYES